MKARLSVVLMMVAVLCAGMAGVSAAAQEKRSAGAAAQKNDTVQIRRITGTIRIVTPDNKVITVTRGDRMPEIPSGSKIMVLSGRAEVLAGGTRAVLGERQSLVVSRDESSGAMRLSAAEGSAGIIRVRAGSSTVLLAGGDAISVTKTGDNKQEITAEQGNITVITPQGKQELKEGGQISTDTVTQRPERQGGENPVTPEPPQPKPEEASPSSL